MARLASLLVAGFVVAASVATPADGRADAPAATPPAVAASARAVVAHSQRGETYRARRYGVDHLQVHWTSSGASLEFRYRVVDTAKAGVLNDKRATPYLIDRKTGIKLTVPTMEKVGTLRQTSTAETRSEERRVGKEC